MCSPTADFADVRECSPVSKLLVALRIRSLANGGEHAAGDWGSRGRRFKSCHPDGKQQVRGRFGEIRGGLFPAWRPECSNGCGNGTHSHQPIAVESRLTAERAPSVEKWLYTSAVTTTDECPSSSETVCVRAARLAALLRSGPMQCQRPRAGSGRRCRPRTRGPWPRTYGGRPQLGSRLATSVWRLRRRC